MTEGVFSAFQAASGDNHPIHYDREYCRRRGHSDMLAHGMQTFIQTAAGAGLFPHLVDDALIGLIEASFKVLKPAYLGDTLYAALEITDIAPPEHHRCPHHARDGPQSGECAGDGWRP